jgi:tetratricopeptide (TPR) repeat protein
MKTQSIIAILGLAVVTSCKKEHSAASAGSEERAARHSIEVEGVSPREDRRRDRADSDRTQERARRHEFSKLLETARKSFDERDVRAALAALEEADGLYESNPDMLNLHGSCYVELRDFEKALTDFSGALEKLPHNPSILFNIGEVHFVSKRWDDATKSFTQAKDSLPPESDVLRQLIAFKLMLCEIGRGNRDGFEALADTNSQVHGTPLSEYTNVVRAFQAEDPDAARDALNAVAELFPGAETRAPWNDTLVEFGYITFTQEE